MGRGAVSRSQALGMLPGLCMPFDWLSQLVKAHRPSALGAVIAPDDGALYQVGVDASPELHPAIYRKQWCVSRLPLHGTLQARSSEPTMG